MMKKIFKIANSLRAMASYLSSFNSDKKLTTSLISFLDSINFISGILEAALILFTI